MKDESRVCIWREAGCLKRCDEKDEEGLVWPKWWDCTCAQGWSYGCHHEQNNDEPRIWLGVLTVTWACKNKGKKDREKLWGCRVSNSKKRKCGESPTYQVSLHERVQIWCQCSGLLELWAYCYAVGRLHRLFQGCVPWNRLGFPVRPLMWAWPIKGGLNVVQMSRHFGGK